MQQQQIENQLQYNDPNEFKKHILDFMIKIDLLEDNAHPLQSIMELTNQIKAIPKQWHLLFLQALYTKFGKSFKLVHKQSILYLADSIVKACLPDEEVMRQIEDKFCKMFVHIYVDVSKIKNVANKVHASLRQLRKTWVGMLSQQCLESMRQIILVQYRSEDIEKGFTQDEIDKLKAYYQANNIDLEKNLPQVSEIQPIKDMTDDLDQSSQQTQPVQTNKNQNQNYNNWKKNSVPQQKHFYETETQQKNTKKDEDQTKNGDSGKKKIPTNVEKKNKDPSKSEIIVIEDLGRWGKDESNVEIVQSSLAHKKVKIEEQTDEIIQKQQKPLFEQDFISFSEFQTGKYNIDVQNKHHDFSSKYKRKQNQNDLIDRKRQYKQQQIQEQQLAQQASSASISSQSLNVSLQKNAELGRKQIQESSQPKQNLFPKLQQEQGSPLKQSQVIRTCQHCGMTGHQTSGCTQRKLFENQKQHPHQIVCDFEIEINPNRQREILAQSASISSGQELHYDQQRDPRETTQPVASKNNNTDLTRLSSEICNTCGDAGHSAKNCSNHQELESHVQIQNQPQITQTKFTHSKQYQKYIYNDSFEQSTIHKKQYQNNSQNKTITKQVSCMFCGDNSHLAKNCTQK